MYDDKITRTPNQARAGSTPHIVRYILAISLILALIGMAIGIAIYFNDAQPAQRPTADTVGAPE